ncbi:MAG: ectonucleotide pyrophosphatase/phosphodiesterase [Calditrichia bacterium]
MKKQFLSFIIGLWILIIAGSIQAKPYVILISIDGFRYDYIERGLTPNLEKLANEGVKAFSLQPSFPSKTFPNHYTIITGLYPQHHGLVSNSFKDPFTGMKYRLSDRSMVENPRWYRGEPLWTTAEMQGIRTACFFWPGSEIALEYKRPSRFKYYDQEIPYQTRVDSIGYWISLPESERPHLLFLYFEFVDLMGHIHGPNSKQLNDALKDADQALGNLLKKIEQLSYRDSINIVVVSDHGMQELLPEGKREIYMEDFLPLEDIIISHYGALGMITPKNNNDLNAVYETLKANENHYRVYLRENMPDYLHYGQHPFIAPIVLIPDPGYQIEGSRSYKKKYASKGDHGYDHTTMDMHGIFIANGPAFKKEFKTGTLLNIDIYPLLCKILNIIPNAPIDGKLERIGYILKDE